MENKVQIRSDSANRRTVQIHQRRDLMWFTILMWPHLNAAYIKFAVQRYRKPMQH